MCLSVSDCCASLCWILNYADANCVIMGGLKLYFFETTALWGLVISLSIVHAIWNLSLLRHIHNPKILHPIVWGLPLIPFIIAESTGIAGPERFWCWMKESDVIYRVILFDIPTAIIIVINVTIYYLASKKIKEIRKELGTKYTAASAEAQRSQDLAFHLKINSFILLYILCWMWIVLDDVTDSLAPNSSNYILMISSVISPIQGVGNAIIFNTIGNDNVEEKQKHSSQPSSNV